jgi:glycosyltransferase involved in cell wall biosynthesis
MRITITVTNELNYDQRMIRICNSLANAGNIVKLIGVKHSNSPALEYKNYQQKRLHVIFKKGFGFYFEYNVRLFFYLLFQKTDVYCCIDLDTMLPVYFASFLKRKIKVYDAHEYFSQQKEIITRPKIYSIWHFIERTFVPKFKNGYTVSEGIAQEFLKNYHVRYEVIRNVALLKPLPEIADKEKIIIYQGSVNEGRGFEYVIPAMKDVNAILEIYGDGNFLSEAKKIAIENNLEKKIIFKGKFLPGDLDTITSQAYIGINLVEPFGQNQLLSLANKFFDYMHHAVPQVTMDFTEYRKINEEYEVAILIKNLSIASVSNSLNFLLNEKEVYLRLQENCLKARELFNWQNEEKKLIRFYNGLKLR